MLCVTEVGKTLRVTQHVQSGAVALGRQYLSLTLTTLATHKAIPT